MDWWALGVLLFEMTAGHAPFHADQESTLYENIVRAKVILATHQLLPVTLVITVLCRIIMD